MRTIPETRRLALPDDPGTGEAPETGYGGMVARESLPIHEYLRIVYRRRWMIVAIMVAGLLGSVLYNWRATPIFEAWATLQIQADPNVLGLDRPLVDQRDWMSEFLPTQLGILESRELARIAREELKLADRSNPGGTAGAASPSGSPGALPPRERESQVPEVIDIVAGRMVSAIKGTRLVNVGFSSTDRVLAAQVANALAQAYVKWTFELKASTAGQASDWLLQQAEEQRKRVQASEAALQAYRTEHGAEALGEREKERQNIVLQKLGDLQAAGTRARTETIDKQTQYQQLMALQSRPDALDTLPAIASNPFIQRLKQELASLQQERAQASEQLGERHPDLIKLQNAVENAEQKLRTEILKVAAAIRNDYESARARESGLAAALERQKAEVQDLNAKGIEYTALDQAAAINRQLLDDLLQRSRQITLSRDLPSANARILDPADVPDEPILPRKERNIMLAVFGSGGLALTLVFLLEVLKTRVTTPDDVKRHLQIPVLGVAPQVKPQKGHISLLLGDGAPPRFAELLHGVRTNLLVAPELATVRTLLVTSSEPGEGKTMAAANLAVSLARLKQRVLLIDADLRSPRLHEVFGVEQQPGLTDVLTKMPTPSALRKTKFARLWLMPSGIVSRNPSDLLSSERFSELIDHLGGQFDWVVLDSAPVLAVTDPCLIARVVSGVLFVVGCGKTSRTVACAALERLDAVGAHIVGAMLNRVVLDRPGESYLPYYHWDYPTSYPQQEDSFDQPELPGKLSKDDSAAATAPQV